MRGPLGGLAAPSQVTLNATEEQPLLRAMRLLRLLRVIRVLRELKAIYSDVLLRLESRLQVRSWRRMQRRRQCR